MKGRARQKKMPNTIELIFIIICTGVYFLFDKIEINLIEWDYEKTLKNRLFIGKGEYIDLTDEEFDSIKENVNKSAKDIIKSIEKEENSL